MNARDDYPEPPRRHSRAGSETAFERTRSGWRQQREAMCDEIDRLRAELAEVEARCERMTIKANQATTSMAVLGKAARDASDMLTHLRCSEGVQAWHEDRLDDIDRCIEAIEAAPAR